MSHLYMYLQKTKTYWYTKYKCFNTHTLIKTKIHMYTNSYKTILIQKTTQICIQTYAYKYQTYTHICAYTYTPEQI